MIAPLFATLALMCSPQDNKLVKRTCITWMRQCVYEQENKYGLTEDQSLEVCIENLDPILWPK